MVEGKGQGIPRVVTLAAQLELILGCGGHVPEVAGTHVAGGCDFVVGSHECTQHAVTGGVEEEGAGDARPASTAGVLGGDGRDLLVAGLRGIHALVEKQAQVGLCAGQGELALVIIYVPITGVAVSGTLVSDQFGHHVAHVGVGFLIRVPLGPDPHLRAAVAAKHRPILDQRHLQALARGRDGGRRACHTTAHHDEIEPSTVRRLQSQGRAARTQPGQLLALVRWHPARIGREQDRIAAAFEAREVVQTDLDLVLQFTGTPVLPVPRLALGTEDGLQGRAIEQNLKSARRARGIPWCHPIAGPHPDAVGPRTGKIHRAGTIGHGYAQAVSKHIGRSHQVHHLLVHHPAAAFTEGLGFDEHGPGRLGLGRALGDAPQEVGGQASWRALQDQLAVGVDHEGRGDGAHAVAAKGVLVGVDADPAGQGAFLEERLDVRRSLVRHQEELDLVVFEFFSELIEVRHGTHTGCSPGCPELQHDQLAA